MSDGGKGDPAYWHCIMHEGFLNGLTQRWADTAATPEEKSRPVILFLHGFPESWFSWRHQMKAVHEAGYRGIAPYMRGYGDPKGGPTDVAEYNMYRLASDMLALLQVRLLCMCVRLFLLVKALSAAAAHWLPKMRARGSRPRR